MMLRIILALIVILGCSAFDLYWVESQQPRINTQQSMRQFEVHKDGRGDDLAGERRIVTRVSYLPPVAVTFAGVLVVAMIFHGPITNALKKAKERIE
jgi:hypothetical protein